MREYDKDRPLISIHIPKCAGTSFLKVLRKWYGRRFYTHYFNEQKNKMPRKHDLKSGFLVRRPKKGMCIHGHFNNTRGFGVQHYYPTVDQFITILRDPLETAISNYFYVKNLGDRSYRDGKPYRFEDQWSNVNEYLMQARSPILQFMPLEMTMGNYAQILETYFVYVGISEHLQESVDILARKLGFPTTDVQRLNVAERNEEVSQDARTRFINNNLVQFSIYQWALENYTRQCS